MNSGSNRREILESHPVSEVGLGQGGWEKYLKVLDQEGFIWWFNMDIPAIAFHLKALAFFPQSTPLPFRVSFLSTAIKNPTSLESFENFYHAFMKQGDYEALAAVTGAGIISIWDSGMDFDRMEVWDERICQLLEKEDLISPLARAYLLSVRGLVETVYHGNPLKVMNSLKEQQIWAERVHSIPLRLYRAFLLGYNLQYIGDFSYLEVVLNDVAPLCELPDLSFLEKTFFHIARGLSWVLQWKIAEGKALLKKITDHPDFDKLPPSIWLLANCHLLLAVSYEKDKKEVEAISERIGKRAIPGGNHYIHGYLLLQEPYKALLYGQEAMERGRKSMSPLPEAFSALLTGQAMSDLGRLEEALGHLIPWIDRWQKMGFNCFTATGAFEVSYLLSKKGEMQEARRYHQIAFSFLPQGERFFPRFRSPDFVERLKHILYSESVEVSDWVESDGVEIHIQTFGGFRIRIRGHIFHDRKWQGTRSMTLLKALIVYGGTKVPTDLLMDLLWPETDGDLAKNNLKVTLSRLRKMGGQEIKPSLPWIMVQNKHISLNKALCSVDSILFKTHLDAALKDKNDLARIGKALDWYQNDFLIHEKNENWIISHRNSLREDFIRGVIAFTELCLLKKAPDKALPYLQKALNLDPLQEDIYGLLMQTYLELGYPSKAIQVFNQAKEFFRRELGIIPGPALNALVSQITPKKLPNF